MLCLRQLNRSRTIAYINLKNLIKLLRLKNWIKNTIIIAPIFFAGESLESFKLIKIITTFLSFSLLASAIYIFNDLNDIEHDRLHPEKKHRPLASSKIKLNHAILMCISLIICSFILVSFYLFDAIFIFISYLIVMILYCLCFRKIAIIDVGIIAFGFVLRLFVGSISFNIEISSWIIIMTFLTALFISLAKRRDDFIRLASNQKIRRESLNGYNSQLIDYMIIILSPIIIVCYILYCISDINIVRLGNDFYLTSIYVIFGFFRYLQIIFVFKKGGDPVEIIYSDPWIKVLILIWILNFYWVIYL